jgi:hypothetical protein
MNEAADKKSLYWTMVIGGCISFVLFLPFVLGHAKVATICPVTQDGHVVANRLIDGRLRFVTGNFVVSNDQIGEVSLARCSKGCTGPFRELGRGKIGKPVHAEFCGKVLVSVTMNRTEIYKSIPPSQNDLDEAKASLRKVFSVILGILLCAVLYGILGLRRIGRGLRSHTT